MGLTNNEIIVIVVFFVITVIAIAVMSIFAINSSIKPVEIPTEEPTEVPTTEPTDSSSTSSILTKSPSISSAPTTPAPPPPVKVVSLNIPFFTYSVGDLSMPYANFPLTSIKIYDNNGEVPSSDISTITNYKGGPCYFIMLGRSLKKCVEAQSPSVWDNLKSLFTGTELNTSTPAGCSANPQLIKYVPQIKDNIVAVVEDNVLKMVNLQNTVAKTYPALGKSNARDAFDINNWDSYVTTVVANDQNSSGIRLGLVGMKPDVKPLGRYPYPIAPPVLFKQYVLSPPRPITKIVFNVDEQMLRSIGHSGNPFLDIYTLSPEDRYNNMNIMSLKTLYGINSIYTINYDSKGKPLA